MQNSTNDDTSPANNSRARAIRPGTSLIPGPWTSQTSCPGPRPKGCRRRPVSKGKELAFFFPPEGVQGKKKVISAKALRGKRSRPLEAGGRERPTLLEQTEKAEGVPAWDRGLGMRE